MVRDEQNPRSLKQSAKEVIAWFIVSFGAFIPVLYLLYVLWGCWWMCMPEHECEGRRTTLEPWVLVLTFHVDWGRISFIAACPKGILLPLPHLPVRALGSQTSAAMPSLARVWGFKLGSSSLNSKVTLSCLPHSSVYFVKEHATEWALTRTRFIHVTSLHHS